MYAAVPCLKCGRTRIIDLSSVSSKCPYCGTVSETKAMRILLKGEDAREVREKLVAVTSPKEPPKEKRTDIDPMSTLQYSYERAKGADKLTVLCEGLDRIVGSFTLDDVRIIDKENAEELIKRMMHSMLVIEERPGVYRSC